MSVVKENVLSRLSVHYRVVLVVFGQLACLASRSFYTSAKGQRILAEILKKEDGLSVQLIRLRFKLPAFASGNPVLCKTERFSRERARARGRLSFEMGSESKKERLRLGE